MTKSLRVVPLIALMAALPAAAENLRAEPSGYQEVPTLSSGASASFNSRINAAGTELEYVLTYGGFQTPVLQSHLHLGQRATNGGIMVFLCTNLGNGPAGTPACPTPGGTVSGVLNSTGVVGPAAQGISPGDFAKVVDAIRSGVAYANIHTQAFPGGEIRGQVESN